MPSGTSTAVFGFTEATSNDRSGGVARSWATATAATSISAAAAAPITARLFGRDGRRVPVLVGLAVNETPGVEPGRRVLRARLARIGIAARHHYGDVIVFRDHCGHLRRQRRARVDALHLHHLREERDNAGETGGRVRVVLDVALRQPFLGAIPLA